MMTAGDVIESYVRDVARYLPRAKRNDVAFELRALLHDELGARAAAQGRPADREMAMGLLAGFGRPAEAAARYHPRKPLIDPADNHNFLIWTVVGALLVPAVHPRGEQGFLEWLGVVFLGFAFAAWLRRRRPADRLDWRPRRDLYADAVSRPLVFLPGLALLVFPFAQYLAPRTWWKVATFGAGYDAGLVLTDAFLHSWQRAATLASLGLMVALYAVATVQGGWRAWSRRMLIFANFLVGALLAMHAGPMVTLVERRIFTVFESPAANGIAMPIFGLVGSLMVLISLYDLYREWARVTPAPALAGASSA